MDASGTFNLTINGTSAFTGAVINANNSPDSVVAAVTDLSAYSLPGLLAICQATQIPYTLPSGRQVSLVLPEFLTMSSMMGVMLDPNNNEVTVTAPDPAMGNVNSTFRVIAGVGIACADRNYFPIFLSRTPVGSGTANLQTFDPNAFAYLCLNARDPNDLSQKKWYCGQGMMADGVTGYAVKNGTQSPRSFWAQSLIWGGNTYTRHYEFTFGGLASIATNIHTTDSGYAQGYASDYAWGLNPRQTHAAPFARAGKSKWDDYLAALATKTSTNRNGVVVSPYNNNNNDAGSFNAAELNECQGTYTNLPDISSNGRIEDGVLINLMTNSWYQLPANGCSWASDWGLAQAPNELNSSTQCSSFTLDPTGANASMPILGINLNDTQQRRCPNWTACATGYNCCLANYAPGNRMTYALKATGALYQWNYNPTNNAPVQVTDGNSNAMLHVREIATSSDISCFRNTDGTVQCVGDNMAGEGGIGNANPISAPLTPVQIDPATGGPGTLTDVEQLSTQSGVAASNVCARTTAGVVYCWGYDKDGFEIPDGDANNNLLAYQINLGGAKATQIAVGMTHTIALMTDGTTRTWGDPSSGGTGSCTSSSGAVCNPSTFTNVIGVAAGEHLSCVLRQDASVWCTGENDHGQLGQGSTTSINGWVQVKKDSTTYLTDVTQIAVRGVAVCALVGSGGNVYCWGAGAVGAVGTAVNVKYATQLSMPAIFRLEAGYDNGGAEAVGMCARDLYGQPWCWGENSNFEIGGGGGGYVQRPMNPTTISCP